MTTPLPVPNPNTPAKSALRHWLITTIATMLTATAARKGLVLPDAVALELSTTGAALLSAVAGGLASGGGALVRRSLLSNHK